MWLMCLPTLVFLDLCRDGRFVEMARIPVEFHMSALCYLRRKERNPDVNFKGVGKQEIIQ